MLFKAVTSTIGTIKKFKQPGMETDKDNFKCAKDFQLQKLLIKRKNFTLRKKFQKIRTIPKNSAELSNL